MRAEGRAQSLPQLLSIGQKQTKSYVVALERMRPDVKFVSPISNLINFGKSKRTDENDFSPE